MENLLTGWLQDNFPEVKPKDFYRYIFPAGELDEKDAMTKGKYTGIICRISRDQKGKNGKNKVYRCTLTDDLDAVDDATLSTDFCVCRPLSYAGKKATAENARRLYAIAVDVDRVKEKDGEPLGLINLWERHITKLKRIPQPTFIVSSGTGLHLYYVLDEPIKLFAEKVAPLQKYKNALTRLIWHDTIVNIKSVIEIQQEGIYQGFRMPGTITKRGDRARAFCTGERVTIDYLNTFVDAKSKIDFAASLKKWRKTHIKLEDAAEKYPDWYERRIVRGEPRGAWAVNRRVYDWWKEQIMQGATVGHRYYCIMILAIYAKKCGRYDPKHNPNPVTREELEADCFGLLDHMEGMTRTPDNHFSTDDILAALEAYDEHNIMYPRKQIEFRTGITIPENRRNGRKQADHIKLMNLVREEVNGNKNWHGRKSKESVVTEWRELHPDGKKADCIRDTGLTKPTVYKYWEDVQEDKRKTIAETRRDLTALATELKTAAGAASNNLHRRTIESSAEMLEVANVLLQQLKENTESTAPITREWIEKAKEIEKIFMKAEEARKKELPEVDKK